MATERLVLTGSILSPSVGNNSTSAGKYRKKRVNAHRSSTIPVLGAELRLANEKSKEHAVAEGIAIAREALERVRGAVQGVQVSAPFGKVELALEVFRG